MSEWNDQALILRSGKFREADLWLKMLCRERGLLTLFAFGGAKSKKRFCGCLDVFNSLQCRVKSSTNGAFLNLQEAVLLDGPRNLRKNWRAMGIAANCLRFVESMSINPENAKECFILLEDLRKMLESRKDGPAFVPIFFRLRMASALGFAPDFACCCKCGHSNGGRFMFRVDEGKIFCEKCAPDAHFKTRRYCIIINSQVLDLLRKIQYSVPSSWPVDKIANDVARTGSRAIDSFIQFHLDLAWDNGSFRHV